jgi:curli biogenesis system outer membrane secretion channel CsgG
LDATAALAENNLDWMCTVRTLILRSRAMRVLPAIAALIALPLAAQTPESTATTVAVLDFSNSALVGTANYAPLSKGIADMLITQLASNKSIRVVEREQLQAVLTELDLASSTRVDPQTAAKVGKLLGARYFLTGGFLVDSKERMRLDIRAVNVETSEVVYVETVEGKAEDVISLIGGLSTKVNNGLRLPAMRTAALPEPTKVSAANQYRAFFLVSRSIEEQDKKNFPAAIALLREALDIYPNFERAQVRLASLQKGGTEH